MSIPVNCPECGATNKVNDSLAGRRVRCPECGTAVHVPELEMGQSPPPLPGDNATGGNAAESRPVEATPVGASPADALDAEALFAEALDAEALDAEAVPAKPVAAQPVMSKPVAAGAAAAVPLDMDDDDDEPVYTKKKREEDELDMTPMVDVTFLLLIFFMVTAAFSLQKSIEMPRQQTDAPSTTVVEEEEEELETVEVQVDEFGSFLVLATDWQEETPGKQNLITTLKRSREGGADARLVIKVHELCKLQYLVDAMDAGTIAGFVETQVTQVEEFD